MGEQSEFFLKVKINSSWKRREAQVHSWCIGNRLGLMKGSEVSSAGSSDAVSSHGPSEWEAKAKEQATNSLLTLGCPPSSGSKPGCGFGGV